MIALLSECFARGELTVEEFEDRVTLVHSVETAQALQDVAADLSPAELSALIPPLPLALECPKDGSAVAIFGSSVRKGAWAVPRRLRVVAVFGGAELDFRDAQLPAGIVDVDVTAVMGGVDIIVPPTLQVDVNGSAFFGGFEALHRIPAGAIGDIPRLVIHGLAFMGGVQIETRLRGESSREAHHRRRKERRGSGRLGSGDPQ